MSDRVAMNYEDDENVRDEYETDEPDYEFVDEEYIDDESKEESVAEPDESEARVAELRQRLEGSETSSAAAMREIAETMKSLRQQPASPEKEEAIESIEEFEKKVSSGFYDNPYKAVTAILDRTLKQYEKEKLQPAFQQMANVLKDTALDSSKRSATDDETGKFVMSKYADEVEKLVNSGQVQIGPGAYKRAVSQVASEHLDELIDWKIEQREAVKAAGTADVSKPGRNAVPRSVGAAPPKPDSKVQLSRGARDAIYRMADEKSIDREQFLESFVRRNPDQVRKLNRRA